MNDETIIITGKLVKTTLEKIPIPPSGYYRELIPSRYEIVGSKGQCLVFKNTKRCRQPSHFLVGVIYGTQWSSHCDLFIYSFVENGEYYYIYRECLDLTIFEKNIVEYFKKMKSYKKAFEFTSL